MALILNQSQAEAVYSAMCALKKVGMRINTCDDDLVRVAEHPSGVITVYHGDTVREVHAGQSAFATAYGLDHGGEPQSAVAAAAGGLTQTAIER